MELKGNAMFRKLRPFILLTFLTLSQPAGAADLVVDGRPDSG